MSNQLVFNKLILVVEAVEETRDGIEKLLRADGYRVEAARNEEEAIAKATRLPPDAIVISWGGATAKIIQTAQRIRLEAGLQEEKVPIVLFCIESVPQGEELAVGSNVFLTQLDNFNQLRTFLVRLLAS